MIQTNNYYETFKTQHQTPSSHSYLQIEKKRENQIIYKVVDKSPEFISQYAFHRFQELENSLTNSQSQEDKTKFQETARLIYSDYKKEYRQLPRLQKALHSILVFCRLRESEKSIESLYQGIQIKDTSSGITLGANLKGENLEERRVKHRNPQLSNYGNQALTKGPVAEELKRSEPPPPPQKDVVGSIATAKRKENAYQKVYKEVLPDRISKGYYDPAIIPYDIEKLLGPVDEISKPIVSQKLLKEAIKAEVAKYQNPPKQLLTEHQAHHLEKDALSVAKKYLKAFPEKSYREAFFLTRDLIRVATYQEYYDKASFNGSDHGSKHIHHNISNAMGLHKGMEKLKDYTDKDKFIEQLVHFYHDIGYTVGLANTDFDCCKDHPFIGAKMIEENREYFLHYLDETSFETLRDCVLFHAIVNPDLTAREEKNGMHPNMVRSVTSISDACAVTYDRKTQEFWEQPRALVALARLKTFLVLYPDYKSKLGDDIVKGPWEGYSENNPWDKMAYDIFLNTVNELEMMVKDYDIPEEKKNLFRQAIKQQFNAFKANVTLGQYGAVLGKLTAVPNTNKITDEHPDYIPEFTLAPSLIYGVLKDLFGEDQANDAFKKLADEFNADMEQMKAALNIVSAQVTDGKKVPVQTLHTGNAIFRLLNRFDHDVKDKHMTELQKNLKEAMNQIQGAFKNQFGTMERRNLIMKQLNEWYKANQASGASFSTFAQNHLLPLLSVGSEHSNETANYEILLRLADKKAPLTDNEFKQLKSAITMLCISDDEYLFMRGKEVPPRKTILEGAIYTPPQQTI